jgi:hypothetical protein
MHFNRHDSALGITHAFGALSHECCAALITDQRPPSTSCHSLAYKSTSPTHRPTHILKTINILHDWSSPLPTCLLQSPAHHPLPVPHLSPPLSFHSLALCPEKDYISQTGKNVAVQPAPATWGAFPKSPRDDGHADPSCFQHQGIDTKTEHADR